MMISVQQYPELLIMTQVSLVSGSFIFLAFLFTWRTISSRYEMSIRPFSLFNNSLNGFHGRINRSDYLAEAMALSLLVVIFPESIFLFGVLFIAHITGTPKLRNAFSQGFIQ